MPQSLLTNYTDVLTLFASNINNKDLAKVVMEHLKSVVKETGASIQKVPQWDQIVSQICLLYQSSMPKLLVDELRNEESESLSQTGRSGGSGQGVSVDPKQKFEQCYSKCTVQLLLTSVVQDLIALYFEKLSKDQIQKILKSLDAQYKFAKEFNTEVNLRFKLHKQGF